MCKAFDFTIYSREERQLIAGSLFFDRRKQHGFGGRALLADVQVGERLLRKGDRLETNDALKDNYMFDYIEEFPAVVRFWRTTTPSRLNRECILFRIPGLLYETALWLCELHTMDLGLLSRYIAFSFWIIVLANVFHLEVSTKPELVGRGLKRLRAELWHDLKAYLY